MQTAEVIVGPWSTLVSYTPGETAIPIDVEGTITSDGSFIVFADPTVINPSDFAVPTQEFSVTFTNWNPDAAISAPISESLYQSVPVSSDIFSYSQDPFKSQSQPQPQPQPQPRRPDVSLGILLGVLVLVVVAAILLGEAVYLIRRRRHTSQPPVIYKAIGGPAELHDHSIPHVGELEESSSTVIVELDAFQEKRGSRSWGFIPPFELPGHSSKETKTVLEPQQKQRNGENQSRISRRPAIRRAATRRQNSSPIHRPQRSPALDVDAILPVEPRRPVQISTKLPLPAIAKVDGSSTVPTSKPKRASSECAVRKSQGTTQTGHGPTGVYNKAHSKFDRQPLGTEQFQVIENSKSAKSSVLHHAEDRSPPEPKATSHLETSRDNLCMIVAECSIDKVTGA
ncbi:MAG: hypothetical protein M1820_006930 [Bogoriella megaspora]|nr:MAG: hypothetical protein M1820_006930 [Bogoriella megaspora]